MTRTITPPELARRYGVDAHKVNAWIRSGELRAVNVGTSASGRPRWVIHEHDIAAFEAARAVPALTRPRRRKSKQHPAGYVEYI